MSDRDDPRNPDDRPEGDTPTEAFDPRGEETPTEAFDPRSGHDSDAPTERFDAAADTHDAGPGDAATRRLPQQPGELRYPDDAAATRRMPNPGSDAPTERFGAQSATPAWQPSPRDVPVYEAAAAPPRNGPRPPKETSNGGRIALIIIGVLLAVALIVLALVFFNPQNSDTAASPTPSTSETPNATPTETPTPTPEPEPEPEPEPAPAATFVSFAPADNTEIACPDEEAEVPITFSWTSSDAAAAWIAAGETDARANPDASVDPSGTYRDLVFDCSQETEIYTISLENIEGEQTNQSVTLRRALSQ